MFDELKRLAKGVLNLNANLIIQQIILNNKFQEFILDLNRREQLFEGLNSLGVELDSYSEFTESELNAEGENRFQYKGKKKSKLAGEPVFLFDSGDFYESFTLEVNTDSLIFDADPIKDDGTNLFNEYGSDILGLTEESTEILVLLLREKAVPIIQNEISRLN